jgi:hypothetical protein
MNNFAHSHLGTILFLSATKVWITCTHDFCESASREGRFGRLLSDFRPTPTSGFSGLLCQVDANDCVVNQGLALSAHLLLTARLQSLWSGVAANGAIMKQRTSTHAQLRWFAPFLALFLTFPLSAYDDISTSENAIRDAYFFGTRHGSLTPEFLARYARWIPELKEGTCTSQVRLETPFLQIADYASKASNFSSQDAVRQFYGKKMVFRVHLDICYKPNAPPNAIKVKVFQNKKEIPPLSVESNPYVPRVSKLTTLAANGERVRLEFKSNQIDSSTLVIRIDTPDEQHAEVDLDLQTLR